MRKEKKPMSQDVQEMQALDLASAAFKVDPYPVFARLRFDDAVHLISSDQQNRTWLITRYQEAEQALRDERFVKYQGYASLSQGPGEHPPSEADLVTMGMVDFDPPDHTRLRSLVAPFF